MDKLTVGARISTALARELTYAETVDVVSAAMKRAKGDGQVANTAARVLLDFTKLAGLHPEDSGDAEGIAWEDMTPQQRAAARAIVEREVAALQAALDQSDAE